MTPYLSLLQYPASRLIFHLHYAPACFLDLPLTYLSPLTNFPIRRADVHTPTRTDARTLIGRIKYTAGILVQILGTWYQIICYQVQAFRTRCVRRVLYSVLCPPYLRPPQRKDDMISSSLTTASFAVVLLQARNPLVSLIYNTRTLPRNISSTLTL